MNITWQPEGMTETKRILAIQILLERHPHLLHFLFRPDRLELKAEPAELLCAAGGFSHGAIVLILIALDLWCDEGGASLTEAAEVLDTDNWGQFMKALIVFGGGDGQ